MTKTENAPITGLFSGIFLTAMLAVVGFLVFFWFPFIGGIILLVAAISVLSTVYGLFVTRKGPCPYCGENVLLDGAMSKAATCRVCKQRIIVRDNNLYKLDEIAQ